MYQRRVIARMYEKRISQAEIARTLHRDRSTIFGEIRGNTFVYREMSDLNGSACERRAKLRRLLHLLRVRGPEPLRDCRRPNS
ncbi:helix-turn-helix domain-containing protein [Rhizobium etli]|uniref:helix-turn-helix domain-containing protein n=1 Tax=Rhizobium etli TaxID=29449 RepID=UPI00093D51C0|nr:helix-turn-helix domain-containing protein [Rhizobium etli]